MFRVSVVIAMVALAAAAETAILFAIVTHPAGAGDPTGDAFRNLLEWAAVPLIACVVAALTLNHFGRTVPVRSFGIAVVLGVFFAALGLVQYSHATPGFLMLGFLIQCLLIVISAGRSWRHAI